MTLFWCILLGEFTDKIFEVLYMHQTCRQHLWRFSKITLCTEFLEIVIMQKVDHSIACNLKPVKKVHQRKKFFCVSLLHYFSLSVEKKTPPRLPPIKRRRYLTPEEKADPKVMQQKLKRTQKEEMRQKRNVKELKEENSNFLWCFRSHQNA